MDRECIKKNKAAFEAWLDGKEIERLKTIGWFPEPNPYFTGNQQYRVKPDVVHYSDDGFDAKCGINGRYFINSDKSSVTCPDCLAILNCKYPGLRKAIQERKEFFVKSSDEVQKIANDCGIKWLSGDNYFISETGEIHFVNLGGNYIMGINGHHPEFHLATDSFTAPIPEWVKHGQKAFYGEKLVTIEKYNPDLHLPIYVSSDKGNHQSWTAVSDLTPAVLHAPTFDELAARMPFAIKHKTKNLIYTVARIEDGCVFFNCGNLQYIDRLNIDYTFADGSEIESWVKA